MFVFLNVALKHLPRVKFGFLNMEIFLAVANIAADILWTCRVYVQRASIPCLFFLMLHLNMCRGLDSVF